MRSAVLLLTGFGLVVGGVAIIALSGGLVLGIAAILLGLLAKGAGFLLGDSPAVAPGRGPQTLAGRRVERPRAGIPVGGRAGAAPRRAGSRRGPADPGARADVPRGRRGPPAPGLVTAAPGGRRGRVSGP